MGLLYDRVRVTVSGTPGTGAFNLGGAVASYRTFGSAGALDGDVVSYLAEAGTDYEFGQGTLSNSTTTLTRTRVLGSSNGGNAVNFTAGTIVTCTALAFDFHQRKYSIASIGTLPINTYTYDNYMVTALASSMTISADAGSPVDGAPLMIRILDNGTARSLTWTTGSAKAFRAVGVVLPTMTIVNKTLYIGCLYNAAASRWDVIAVGQEE